MTTANRMMLRLASVCALSNFGAAPYPTLGGPLIFDSRIEKIEDTQEDHAYPLCVVYTDYDKNNWKHASALDLDRMVTVTFELLVVQQKEEEGKTVIDCPTTDSELETAIDIFEDQLFKALAADNVAAECFKYLVSSYDNVISRRGASTESGKRLAARQITLEVCIPREPAVSVIPAPIGAFLNRLEDTPEFGDRVPAMRDMYLQPAGRTGMEQLLDANGWSNSLGGILGYYRGPQSLLPPVVHWLKPDGSPL